MESGGLRSTISPSLASRTNRAKCDCALQPQLHSCGPLSSPVRSQQTVLVARADTYLKQGQSNQNQGSAAFLRIQQSGNNRALVRFDQAEIAAQVEGGSLVSATLELYIEYNANNWGSSGRTVDAHRR